MENNNEIINDFFYDYLLNAIHRLGSTNKIAGGEGIAYFLDDDFVVKEYKESSDWGRFDAVFETYCKEMQNFAMQGYNVPKIYAWLKIPNFDYYTKGAKNFYKYYILEERVKGRNLYYGFLEDFYPACKDMFSHEEFKYITSYPEENVSAYQEIVKKYLKDYIMMNERLESMPEDVLAKFLTDLYSMNLNAKQSTPDIFPSNMLVSDDKISIIDSRIWFEENGKHFSRKNLDNTFLYDMTNLFFYNEEVKNIQKEVKFKLKDLSSCNYAYYQRKNKKVSSAAIERVFKLMNKYCDGFVCTDPKTYMLTIGALNSIVGKDSAEKIIANVPTAFE